MVSGFMEQMGFPNARLASEEQHSFAIVRHIQMLLDAGDLLPAADELREGAA
jgi:hypothetical protein